MPIFRYKALTKEKKPVEGLIEAANKDLAVDTLQDKGLSIIAITESAEFGLAWLSFLRRVKSKDLVFFSRQFAVLISANVAMVQALKILVEQTANAKLKVILSEIAEEVDGGAKLSDALSRRPKFFSNFYTSVVKSGETSGKLNEVLNYLADEMEKDYDMTSKIKGAMIYPAFILSGLTIVGTVMMIFVVPKLTNILTETGMELPITTKILIATSSFLVHFWWLILILLVAIAVGFRFAISQPVGKKIYDYIKLKLPIFGKLFQLIYLVRFTRSLNTLIVGGVTISNGLKVTAEVVGNQVYQELIEETIRQVEEGNSISSVFISSKEIPNMVSQMLSIGEKTGKLDLVLEKLTDFYGREINHITANLMTLMEPIIMTVMGLAVGVMVAAIILPMYNMASQF